MDADTSDGRQLRMRSPMTEKLEMQFSEACQKSFIIFDHSASKRTMVLHPALLKDQSSFINKVTNDRAGLFAHLQDISDKAVDNLLLHDPPADPSTRRARLLAYRETMESAFVALEKLKADGFCSLDHEAGDGVMACLNRSPNKSKASGNGLHEDQSEEIKSEEYEDEEGLDALLDSDDDEGDYDDELNSTGHSPSEATGDNAATCTDDRGDLSKKRKFQMCDPEDEGTEFGPDEADSGQVLLSNLDDECQDAPHLGVGGWDSQICMGHANKGEGYLCREICLLGTLKTISSGNRVHNQGQNPEPSETVKLVKISQKINLKDTIQHIKDVTPAGEDLGMAVILDRAAQYMKSLGDSAEIGV